MYSFSIRQFIREYIGDFFFWKVPFMYSFSIRQFIREYIGDFFFWKVPFMYSFSITQFIREYIGDFYDSWMFGPNFIVTPLMFGGVINTMLTLGEVINPNWLVMK